MQKSQLKASAKKQTAPKKTAVAKKTTSKKVLKQQRRKMTVFAGAKSDSEQVFAAGTVKRVAGGKTTTFPMALELTATPALKTLAVTQHRFIPGSGLVDTYTEALLVDAKGEAGKVKAMTVEPVLKDGAVKFTGPNFAWTKAQISSTNFDGAKLETTLDFAKDKVAFKLVVKGKGELEEAGDFAVVEKAAFYDFIRTSKTAHERMQPEAAKEAEVAAV